MSGPRHHQLARTYSTNEVCALTGASYRQLDYWVRRGLIEGQAAWGVGSGQRRRWTEEQVHRARLLRVAARLRGAPLLEVLAILEGLELLAPIEERLRALAAGNHLHALPKEASSWR